MKALKFARRSGLSVLAMAALFTPDVNATELAALVDDGWYSWRVPVHQPASNWCCFDWNAGVAQRRSCDLDGQSGGYGHDEQLIGISDEMQLYVRMRGGKLAKLWALSSNCPVTARSKIVHLGPIAADISAKWLERATTDDSNKEVREHAMFALSKLGERGVDVLISIVKDRNRDHDGRKKALFWLAQSESERGLDYIAQLLAE